MAERRAVALPPPIIFGAAILAGWLAHRALGWPYREYLRRVPRWL